MARIRSIKPDFFKHYELFQLEEATKLPLRLAFSGLWTVADREGRFKWRPEQIKLDVLPYDAVDMNSILNRLHEFGFICKYCVGDKYYGYIPTWQQHQRPSREEPPSEIPSPSGEMTEYDRPPNQTERARIYTRDNYTCVYCGDNLKDKSRSICLDHVIPYSKGGTNREKNLVTSCKKCNSIKGDRTPAECGLTWPEGFGEVYQHSVNGGLTGGQHPPDTEREGEREREMEGKGNDMGNGGGDEPITPQDEFLGIVIYDAEKEILDSPIIFEQLCMKTGKDPTMAKEALRKYHLWLEEKEQYPKAKKAVFAGFEKWLMNEKKYSNGSASHQGARSVSGGKPNPGIVPKGRFGKL